MTANLGRTADKKQTVWSRTYPAGKIQRLGMLLQAAVCFVLAFLLAGASVLDACAPFAVAFVGASGAGLYGASALTGMAAGYAFFYGLGDGIQYIAAGVMVYTTAFVCQYISVYEKRWFMPIMVTIIVGMTMAFGTVSTVRAELPFLLRLGFDVFSSGIMTYLYMSLPNLINKSLEDWGTTEFVSAVSLLASLLSAMSGRICVYEISVGRMLACLSIIAAAYCGGSVGCAVGTGTGIAMDMVSASSTCFTMSYALSGLLSGAGKGKGKLYSAAGYLLGTAAVAMLFWDAEKSFTGIYEAVCGVALFLMIPKRSFHRFSTLMGTVQPGAGESRLRRYAAYRMVRMSRAFSALERVLQEEPTIFEPGMDEIFDRAAESVCAGCSRKSVCWTNHYLDMLVILDEATPIMKRRGRLKQEDLPGYFCDYCPNCDQLILAINYELRRNADKRMIEMNQREYAAAGAVQYRDFAALLQELAEGLMTNSGGQIHCEQKLLRHLRSLGLDCEVGVFRDVSGRLRITISGNHLNRLTGRAEYMDELSQVLGMRLCRPSARKSGQAMLLLEAEPYAVTVGVASKKKRGEDVSGDRGRYFKSDGGILYVILSDGLGTGDDAAEQSSVVVDVLEQLLRSGVSAMSAMKLVNSVMLMKNREAWGYATVDLLSVNLFSGEASFYKYGAAPSYVHTQNGLQRIVGETLSAGMNSGGAHMPDAQTMQLSPGNVVVIASDGVIIGDENTLTRQIVEEQGSMKTLARRILLSSRESDPFGDDMTVLTVGLEVRK